MEAVKALYMLLLLSSSPSAPHYYCPSMSLGGVLASPAAYIPYRPSILKRWHPKDVHHSSPFMQSHLGQDP